MRRMDITEHQINDVEGKQSSSLKIQRKKIKKIKMKDVILYICISGDIFLYIHTHTHTHMYRCM